jgi:hypothetical protein
MAAGDIGAGPELADQHDLVADRIVGQHGSGLSALEHLALQDPALAALVEAVAEEVATDAKVTLERHDVLDELDGLIGQDRRRHGKAPDAERPPSRESGPESARHGRRRRGR